MDSDGLADDETLELEAPSARLEAEPEPVGLAVVAVEVLLRVLPEALLDTKLPRSVGEDSTELGATKLEEALGVGAALSEVKTEVKPEPEPDAPAAELPPRKLDSNDSTGKVAFRVKPESGLEEALDAEDEGLFPFEFKEAGWISQMV